MNEIYINSGKPIAALIEQSHFDDEPIIIPLTPKAQEAFNRRATLNRRGKIVNVEEN